MNIAGVETTLANFAIVTYVIRQIACVGKFDHFGRRLDDCHVSPPRSGHRLRARAFAALLGVCHTRSAVIAQLRVPSILIFCLIS
jgi:hypothetical protein